MQRITPIATDYQLILEGLEVLRLIADRMDNQEFVDPDDIAVVLGFLREVGCECFEHMENLLLRPALIRANENEQILRLRTALARHQSVRPAIEDTVPDVIPKDFVHRVALFTRLVEDLIEEDQSLLQSAVHLLDDPEGRNHVERFAAEESRLRVIAAKSSPTLHRLETKYVFPHSI